MSDDTRATPSPRRGDDHAGAASNPEQHLSQAHNLSIQLQGKEGSWGRAVWALVREERGKVKTLAVFEGTRGEAANHFFRFIHPNRIEASPQTQRSGGGFRSAPRPGRPQRGKPLGRP